MTPRLSLSLAQQWAVLDALANPIGDDARLLAEQPAPDLAALCQVYGVQALDPLLQADPFPSPPAPSYVKRLSHWWHRRSWLSRIAMGLGLAASVAYPSLGILVLYVLFMAAFMERLITAFHRFPLLVAEWVVQGIGVEEAAAAARAT